jgi:carboxyl-terminal processing protease
MLQWENEFRERTHQQLFDQIPGFAIWKIPAFEFSDVKVDKMIDRVKKGNALILDLRGNSGGLVYSEKELVSAFFDRDVVICDVLSRKKKETEAVKGDGRKAFTGKMAVLVDSESASAAEVFARVIQLEGRGIVIGDQTSGKVMQSITYDHYFGIDDVIGYAFSITDADLIMKDGQRLEKVGVTPDERVLPSPLDLANARDPVLARAAEILGFQLSPEDAGKIFTKKK